MLADYCWMLKRETKDRNPNEFGAASKRRKNGSVRKKSKPKIVSKYHKTLFHIIEFKKLYVQFIVAVINTVYVLILHENLM